MVEKTIKQSFAKDKRKKVEHLHFNGKSIVKYCLVQKPNLSYRQRTDEQKKA